MVTQDSSLLPSEARLRSLLEADAKTGFVTSRDGKISRTHYAKKLGKARNTLSKYANIFKEYEERLLVSTGPMRNFQAMKDWLNNRFQEGTLSFARGKVDRNEFSKHFGLQGGSFIVRNPEIRRLFEDLDRRALEEGYLPASKQKDLNSLKQALANGPALNKDRLSINRPKLMRELSIPAKLLDNNFFLREIDAKEAEIRAAAIESKIDPFFHNRVYEFSDLVDSWDSYFLERVGVCFKQTQSGNSPSTVKRTYSEFHRLLRWIGESDNGHCRRLITETARSSQIRSSEDWEEAIHLYRSQLASTKVTGREQITVDGKIKALRTSLTVLYLAGLAPQLPIPLQGIKLARRRSAHLPSIVEITPDQDSRFADYIQFARTQLDIACKKIGLDVGTRDANAFLESISHGLSEVPKSSSELSIAIRDTLRARLNSIKQSAQEIVQKSMALHESGMELLAIAKIDSHEFEKMYFDENLTSYRRGIFMRSHFPDEEASSSEDARLGLANLLSLIVEKCGGIPPVAENPPDNRYGQFFLKRYLAYGGVRRIGSLLNPSPDAIGAILTLYLIESGANISVARTLESDCIEASELEGHSRITGNKVRARGKAIIVDLPDESLSVQGIRWLQGARDRLSRAADDDNDRLFLMQIGTRVQLMTPHWYTEWFKKFSRSVPGLEDLRLTPNMLRPSVLLEASLSNDGRLSAGMAIGQHHRQVSAGYQVKFPTRLLYDENIRRFQSAFQTLTLADLPEAAANLGISESEFQDKLKHLRPTGLGTYCKDHRGRPGHQDPIGCQTADCWNDCPNLLIVAEVEAIATLQIWKESLRRARPDWERDRPERWDEVWLPWLCLTEVVSEKMVRGPLIKIWNAATARALELSTQEGYKAPKPW